MTLYDKVMSYCNSLWCGCICAKQRDHDDYHECGSPLCDSKWTDDMELDWWNSIAQTQSEIFDIDGG